MGREEVPIHCGASGVLLHGLGQADVPQYAAIAHRGHRIDWPGDTAVDFLRRTIRQRPHEITLLSIGPLTNVALLFALDAEIPGLLKGLVSMAGVFFSPEPAAEWNCRVDPVATAMVYRARLALHVSIGLDVTRKCVMAAQVVRQRFTVPPLDVVREMAEIWFAQRPAITFHDALAAATIFNSAICGYKDGGIAVDYDANSACSGKTTFGAGLGEGRHRVAAQVDPEAFFAEYFGVCGL
jgi:purine nucleosidase